MSDCSLELRQQGEAYPRTCRICGIGRCLNGFGTEGASKVSGTEDAQPWGPASTNAVPQRLPMTLEQFEGRLNEAIGEASMCWSETPTGVFDSTKALEISGRIKSSVLELLNALRHPLPVKAPVANAVPQRLPIPAALADVLNSYCAENGSNTPDFILGDFLASVLENLNQAIRERDKWYGASHRPGETQQSEVEFLRKALDQAIEVSQCVIYTTTEAALRISHRDDIEVKLIACSLNSIRKVEDYPELAEYLRKPVPIEEAKEGATDEVLPQ